MNVLMATMKARQAKPHRVYKITNAINGMLYIGITNQPLDHRWSNHRGDAFKKQADKPLYRDIRQYGADNFTIESLEEELDYDQARNKEIEWMLTLETVYPKGYNLQCPLTDEEAAIIKYDALGWTLEEYSDVSGLCIGSLLQLRLSVSYRHITRKHLPRDTKAYRVRPRPSMRKSEKQGVEEPAA